MSVGFISDLHLSPELPHTVAAFEALLQAPPTDALFILGDLFEAWIGDDMLDLDFEARCADALRRASAQTPIHVMRGNRDFLLGQRFFAETGCTELPDPVVLHGFSESVLVSHGDELCQADIAYQRFRAEVRQASWQAAFLSRPLVERQGIADQMRAASQAHQRGGMAQDAVTWADVDPELAVTWLTRADARLLLHGHTHRPQSQQMPAGWCRHVLSDWDLDHAPTPRAELMHWSAQGWNRLAVSAGP